jgi:flagellar assembly protein FliH
MSLSFEIVRREQAERLRDLVPLSIVVPDCVQPPPWLELLPAPAAAPALEALTQEESAVRGSEPAAEAQPAHLPLAAPEPQKLEQLRQEARAEGFEEGYARGRDEARRQAETDQTQGLTMLSDRFAAAVAQLEKVERQLVAHAESALTEMALSIAERLVRQQIVTDPVLLHPILREALAGCPQVASVKLALNPLDRAVAETELFEMGEPGGSQERHVELVADPSLERGDVVVTTEFGLIDGRIKSQLERIRQRLQTTGALL